MRQPSGPWLQGELEVALARSAIIRSTVLNSTVVHSTVVHSTIVHRTIARKTIDHMAVRMRQTVAAGLVAGLALGVGWASDHEQPKQCILAAASQVSDCRLPNSFPEKSGGKSRESRPQARRPSELGSPYVPLDSWVYPAFDTLAALGYAPSAYADLRPWTRMECARIIAAARDDLQIELLEIHDLHTGHPADDSQINRPEIDASEIDNTNTMRLGDGKVDASKAYALYAALAAEFSHDLQRLQGSKNGSGNDSGAGEFRVDGIYTRYLGIAGQPLDDGYHFGQTLLNDFGRLYGRGSNLVSGASASGTAGAFAFYVRGEYQHAAALPP